MSLGQLSVSNIPIIQLWLMDPTALYPFSFIAAYDIDGK